MIRAVKAQNGLYMLQVLVALISIVNSYLQLTLRNFIVTDTFSQKLWHNRLGHISYESMLVLQRQFPSIQCNISHMCNVCHLAKQRYLHFSLNTTTSQQAFHLNNVDIQGPLSTISIHGHRYFLTIVDDYSRYTLLFLRKSKAEKSNLVQIF